MYLTFDIGTSALKTALVDNQGSLAAISICEYSPISPASGFYEMPAHTYWQALIDGTREVITKAGISKDQIRAIGLSSQGQTFIPLDASGNALHNAIVWLDNRAQGVVDKWKDKWLSNDAFRLTSGYPKIPSELTVFKIAWMAEHAPQAHKAWKFLCLPDYIIYKLCGETVTDPVIAQMTGLRDIRTGTWSPPLLNAADINEGQLPRVLDSGTIAGVITPSAEAETGIPRGIPICMGTNDQIAGAMGSGNVRPGIVTETTGTALAVVATCDELWDSMELTVGRHAVKDQCFALAYAPTSAIVLKWFRDMAASNQSYDELLSEVAQIEPGCNGLTLLPHFAGSGTPSFNSDAKGAIVGLQLSHTRAHIARAIMESCACLLKECIEPISGGMQVDVIRSMGGAARSDIWLQIKADMLGIPVEKPACSDSASIGAAMLAALGAGDFNTLEEAANAWYHPIKTFEPNHSNASIYNEVYQRYRNVYNRLYESVDEH